MTRKQIWSSVVGSLSVLLAGILFVVALMVLQEPPEEVEREEEALPVLAREVQPEDHSVTIEGYGAVGTRKSVEISAEVQGRVVDTHPDLDVGEVVSEGEVLFEINPEDYEIKVRELEANVSQLETAIQRLQTQQAHDQERLENLKRIQDLAREEYERLERLFEEDQVGTRSGVDKAEQAYNQAQDQVDQLKRTLALYPLELEEARSSLTAAQTRLEQAEQNLDRTTVKAPFDARIKARHVEEGQLVSSKAPALSVADDTLLEIQVPVESQDVREWLQFADRENPSGKAWFANPEPVPAEITWTGGEGNHSWTGSVHRIEQFRESTRTLQLTVRVDGDEALSYEEGLPLVEGMFCEVEIPGRRMESVYELPWWAVSFENTVYIANEQRLQTVPVEVARTEGNRVYVSEGLEPGDRVIVTRLSDPLEGQLLDIRLEAHDEEELS